MTYQVHDISKEVRSSMFTGIIEELGRISRIDVSGENRRIQVSARGVPAELKTGDSVSVSGVCLTALDIQADSFHADLAPETWRRTSFSRIKPGALVNLELPMRASGRFDGHIVQGHVDGVGRLQRFEQIAGTDNRWLTIQIPAELEKYVVHKGSLAIEGISLTVADLKGRDCTVAIIPHTVESTNLQSLRPGDPINLEVDIVAKYVEKMMRSRTPESALTVEQLVREGF
jgi:riboflavin synthase